MSENLSLSLFSLLEHRLASGKQINPKRKFRRHSGVDQGIFEKNEPLQSSGAAANDAALRFMAKELCRL